MALLRDIGHYMQNLRILKKSNPYTKSKQQGGFQNKGNDNTKGGKNNYKRGRLEISTNRKNKSFQLKGIVDDIIEERQKAELCPKYGKEPHREFKYYAKSPITNRTVPKNRNKKQKKDTKKKDYKDIKISAVGIVDEHEGRIIKLVTDGDGDL